MNDNELHIVYATDSGYLLPTTVSAGSAIARSSQRKKIFIHILDCGIEDDEWLHFEGTLRGRFGTDFVLARHLVDMRKYEGLPSWHGSLGLYARFEIPEILCDVDWCVYADGDTLFTGDPHRILLQADFSRLILGKKDIVSENQKNWHVSRGLAWNEDERVCSGFLLMNLKRFRKEGISARLFNFVWKYKEDLINPDQDALNCVCQSQIGILPAGWGAFPFETGELSDVWCVHYVPNKPWNPETSGFLPLPFSTWLWLDALKKICGKSPFQMWGLSYGVATVKTVVFAMVFRILNMLPGFCGRYSGGLNQICTFRRKQKYALRVGL